MQGAQTKFAIALGDWLRGEWQQGNAGEKHAEKTSHGVYVSILNAKERVEKPPPADDRRDDWTLHACLGIFTVHRDK
jgi:hypothetical protein